MAVVGGRSREAAVLIGNKRCTFLPFSYLSMFFERTALEGVEDVLTLKVDIFVFACTGEASSSVWMKGWFLRSLSAA